MTGATLAWEVPMPSDIADLLATIRQEAAV